MDDKYLQAYFTVAAKQIAKKLQKQYGLFENIAMMGDDEKVTAQNLKMWAETGLDYMENDTDSSERYISFVEMLFIAQHSEEVFALLKQ